MKESIKTSWWTSEGKLTAIRLNIEKDDKHNFFVEDIESPYPMLPVLHIEWGNILGVALVTEKRPYFISPNDFWLLVFPYEDEIGLRMQGGMLLAFIFDLVSKGITKDQQATLTDILKGGK